MLRPLCVQTTAAAVRLPALRMLDEVLTRIGTPADRLPILRRYFDAAREEKADDVAMIGVELARAEWTVGETEAALQICQE